ncbi:type 1 fimbrial major subunit FimA [Proteus mirabilis]|nr:type 1 fimbrial major subunit FimA [Proteus mirabilis]
MKLNYLKLFVISALSVGSVFAVSAEDPVGNGPVTVNGGEIFFKGELVNAACAVDSSSDGQIVKLGQVRTAKLAKTGDFSENTNFTIQLNDCDSKVASTAKVAFTGVSAAGQDDVLAVSSSSAGGAKNVGIQILDSKSAPMSFDGAGFGNATKLHDGKNIIPFQARYYALGATEPGIANANATFAVQYE